MIIFLIFFLLFFVENTHAMESAQDTQALIEQMHVRIPNLVFDEAHLLQFLSAQNSDDIEALTNSLNKIPALRRNKQDQPPLEVQVGQVHFTTQLISLMQKQTQIQQATFEKSIQDGKDAEIQVKKDMCRNFMYQVIGWVFTGAAFGVGVYAAVK